MNLQVTLTSIPKQRDPQQPHFAGHIARRKLSIIPLSPDSILAAMAPITQGKPPVVRNQSQLGVQGIHNVATQEVKTDTAAANNASVEAVAPVGTGYAELEARLRRLEQLRNQYGVSSAQQPVASIYAFLRAVTTTTIVLLLILRHIQSTWDGLDDPDDPYNWAPWRKVSIGIVFSFGQLVTLMTASMIAAALDGIATDLVIDAATAQIVFATYFLGLAFGPFFAAAFAEGQCRYPPLTVTVF